MEEITGKDPFVTGAEYQIKKLSDLAVLYDEIFLPMLSQLIFEEQLPITQEAIVTPGSSMTWGGLRDDSLSFVDKHRAVGKRRVGLSFSATASGCAALIALERLGADVFLIDSRLGRQEALAISEKLKMGALLYPAGSDASSDFEKHELSDEGKWSGSPTVTILTSGTTGDPKAA